MLDYVPPAELLDRWPVGFGREPGQSLIELVPRVLSESHHLHHPGYIGHEVSAPLPSAALAELVSAILNNALC